MELIDLTTWVQSANNFYSMKSALIKLFKKRQIALKILSIATGFKMESSKFDENSLENGISLFLCGDVMVGRGIDQILPHPSKPDLYEMCVRDANDYVRLAERKNGLLPKRPVDFAYPWGDALNVLEEWQPDVRIVNLETSVTTSDEKWPSKGIHYRMNPRNIGCLKSAHLDCCILANNHVLDWGHSGLAETLTVLERSGIQKAGAGLTRDEAAKPAIITLRDGRGRVLIYGCGDESSGIPTEWAATANRSGVNLLSNGLSMESVQKIVDPIEKEKRPTGDIVVLSIHWGDNWGFDISPAQRKFAHSLINSGFVDLIHGHSSHHVKGVEIYRGKLIIYGCGDFLNDYEGIEGHNEFHDNFCLMYFSMLDSKNGNLLKLEAVPMEVKQMQVKRGSTEASTWLFDTMKSECNKNGIDVVRNPKTNTLKFIT